MTCPLLLPLGMVILLGTGATKSAALASPLRVRSRVWSPVTAAAAVAVTVILVVPASLPVVWDRERLTGGIAGGASTVLKFQVVLPLIPL